MTRARPCPRALIIGIDGGDFAAIDPLVAQGRLPNLAGLLRRGASASTACTWPAHTAPGWSTFITGCRPGGHGVYQFFDTQDQGYGAAIRESGDLGRSSAWDWLARRGYTLGLVNVPMSHPPRDDLPGYQVTWPLRQTAHFCRPPGLLAELARNRAGFRSDLATMFRGDYAYLEQAEVNVAARVRSMSHLMRNHPTDIAMVVFTEVDRVGHHYWHFVDPDHPRYTPPPADSGWDSALQRIYEAVDDAVGELLELVDDTTEIVVVSDHGLGIGRHGFAVHQLLQDAGFLVTKDRSANGEDPAETASWFASERRQVDFERTDVYMPVPGSFGLNVNLRGRQRHGTVDEADYGAVLDDVSALLSEVRLPDGSDRAFLDVVPREIAYPGPYMAAAPDLLLIPKDESLIVVPELEGGLWQPSWQTGLHRHMGMWVHVSPHVVPGRLPGVVNLTDLMPTLLTTLGVSWPSGIQGRPVSSALRPEVDSPPPDPELERAEAEHEPVPVTGASGPEDLYTSQRLREMGYL